MAPRLPSGRWKTPLAFSSTRRNSPKYLLSTCFAVPGHSRCAGAFLFLLRTALTRLGGVLVEGGAVTTVTEMARFPKVDYWLHEVRQQEDPQGGREGRRSTNSVPRRWHCRLATSSAIAPAAPKKETWARSMKIERALIGEGFVDGDQKLRCSVNIDLPGHPDERQPIGAAHKTGGSISVIDRAPAQSGRNVPTSARRGHGPSTWRHGRLRQSLVISALGGDVQFQT